MLDRQNAGSIRSQSIKSRMADGYLPGKPNEEIKAHGENHVNADKDQNGIVVRADSSQGRREQGNKKEKDQPP
jgi:hypothetical protein